MSESRDDKRRPWCWMCGQRHFFSRPCDPAVLAWVHKRMDEIARGASYDEATPHPHMKAKDS